MDRTGKCLCGAVSFLARGLRPEQASVCHCGMCLRWAGGPWIALHLDAIEFEHDDRLAWFPSSGVAERGFCTQCGSSLFWRPTAEGKYQGMTSVALGALDDKSEVTVAREWFIDRKPDCYALAGERECTTEAEALAMLTESS